MRVVMRSTQPLGAAVNGRHLSYRGHLVGIEGQIVGPNQIGEHLVIVTAEYDPATDRTLCGLRYATSADLTSAVPA